MLLRVILLWLVGINLVLAQPHSDSISASLTADRSSVYLNEQVLLTLTVRVRKEAFGLSGGQLDIEDASLFSVHKREYEEEIANVIYQTTVRRFAAFAKQEGRLRVLPIRFQALLPVSFSEGDDKSNPQINAISNGLELIVKAPPASEDVWLPASRLTVSHAWLNADNQPIASARRGEPVNYSVRIELQGQHPAAIPPLVLADAKNLRIYPQQSTWSTDIKPTGLDGTLKQNIIVVGSKIGEVSFPSISVAWWDINQSKWQTATTLAETLMILPAIGDNPASNTSHLVVLAILTTLAIILLAVGYRRHRRRTKQRAGLSERAAWAWIKLSVAQREIKTLRAAIQIWSGHLWPERIDSTSSLVKIKDQELADVVTLLDRMLYSASMESEPDWSGIKSTLKAVRKRHNKPAPARAELEPLYLSD
ncbi:MAG: hypothetical protein ACI9UN_000237 [Granulosicoccus sp.]|jgi:hypothetical protein